MPHDKPREGNNPFNLGTPLTPGYEVRNASTVQPQPSGEEWEREFDAKFGKPTDEDLAAAMEQDFDEESTDRAGCDGCDYNVWWREQIKRFIASIVSEAEARAVEESIKTLTQTPCLDHHCKCEGKHLVSFNAEDFYKMLKLLSAPSKE
jgi:hypothetical protein